MYAKNTRPEYNISGLQDRVDCSHTSFRLFFNNSQISIIFAVFKELTFLLHKTMYQKPMKGVIGTHFKSQEVYSWPNHSWNISIKKVTCFETFQVRLWTKITKNMTICSFWVNFETFRIIPDNFLDRNI